jgi:hypothetical protein
MRTNLSSRLISYPRKSGSILWLLPITASLHHPIVNEKFISMLNIPPKPRRSLWSLRYLNSFGYLTTRAKVFNAKYSEKSQKLLM